MHHRLPSSIKKPLVWLLVALLLSIGLKTWIIVGGWAPFNSDEAVVALMARHIRQGANLIFFYGQAYMGSLDAYLVAGAFSFFGEHVWVVRAVQSSLYLCYLVTVFLLGKLAGGSWQAGGLAALLLAIPPVNVTLYSTVSLGGYGEALLIGNLILLISISLIDQTNNSHIHPVAHWAIIGFLIGLGLWAFGLTLVYSIPVVMLLVWTTLNKIKKPVSFRNHIFAGWILFLFGFLVGSTPWWSYAWENGFTALIVELTGGAVAGVEGLPWFAQILRHLTNLLLIGATVTLGLRPPWSADLLVIPLLPLAVTAWVSALWFCIKDRKFFAENYSARLLGWTVFTLIVAFIFSPFGADPSGRYFLPLAAPLAIFAARGILVLKQRIGFTAITIAGVILIYQFAGNLQSAFRYPPGLTTQFYSPSQIDHRYDNALIEFLKREGETIGYSNYWVTFPLAFLSQEEIIFAPGLPYHLDLRYTDRDDRIKDYTRQAAGAPRTAYITTKNPNLDIALRREFSRLQLSWLETRIGDYQVFYNLSAPVHPNVLKLGYQ